MIGRTHAGTWRARHFLVGIGLSALLAGSGAAVAQDDEQEGIEEITVTGSQIRGAAINEALPVSVVDSEDIEILGVDSGDELLEFMAEQGQNYFSESENISGGVNSARGDVGAYNLRNLGTGNTLVLLNGRRMVNNASYQTEEVGGSFVPVNTVNSQALPVFGLERVEVLRDGASAIYGADAVAGVVNYVLQDDFEGFNLSARYASFDHMPRDDYSVTAEWGQNFNGGATNIAVFGTYYHRDRVNSQDEYRWFESDFRYRIPAGSPWEGSTAFRNNSANSEYGQYDFVSGNLPGFTDNAGEFETYPVGDERCQWDLGYGTCGAIDGQGTYRYNLNENRDLYSDLDRINVYALFSHEFAGGLEAYTEFSYYGSDTNTIRHASTGLSAVADLRVGAQNYYNPFGPVGSPNRLPDSVIGAGTIPDGGVTLIMDNYRWAQVPRIVDNDQDIFRILQGFRGSFGNWDWDGAIMYSKADQTDVTHNRISNTLMQEALNDPTSAAFNPFGGRTNTNIERTLIDVYRNNETELKMADFKISNPEIFELPAGPVALLAGIELRNEYFLDDRDPRLDGTINFTDADGQTFPVISDVLNSSPSFDSEGDRDVTSLFAEMQFPLFENVDVQLAARYEDLSDVGDTTVGRIAVGWRVVDPLLLRASWSTGFRAPNLVTVNEGDVARSNTRDDYVCYYVDPEQELLDCTYGMQRKAGGSANLVPEESTNLNVGLVWEPIEGLTLTYDFWEIEKENTIGLFGEENHTALDLLIRLEAGLANCNANLGDPLVIREDASTLSPEETQLYLDAGICPAGQVTQVDDTYANLDTRLIRGHDIGAYYGFDTSIGYFDIRYVATFLDKYEQVAGGAAAVLIEAKENGDLPETVPVVGFADLVRQDGNPESKHTVRVSWRNGNWGAGVTALRLDDFIQTSLTLEDDITGLPIYYVIPQMTTYNFSADYRFDSFMDTETRVRVGIRNLTDERAPLADDSFGYFADMHSDLGRSYYLDVRLSF